MTQTSYNVMASCVLCVLARLRGGASDPRISTRLRHVKQTLQICVCVYVCRVHEYFNGVLLFASSKDALVVYPCIGASANTCNAMINYGRRVDENGLGARSKPFCDGISEGLKEPPRRVLPTIHTPCVQIK